MNKFSLILLFAILLSACENNSKQQEKMKI